MVLGSSSFLIGSRGTADHGHSRLSNSCLHGLSLGREYELFPSSTRVTCGVARCTRYHGRGDRGVSNGPCELDRTPGATGAAAYRRGSWPQGSLLASAIFEKYGMSRYPYILGHDFTLSLPHSVGADAGAVHPAVPAVAFEDHRRSPRTDRVSFGEQRGRG
jgi:hypothetical protein